MTDCIAREFNESRTTPEPAATALIEDWATILEDGRNGYWPGGGALARHNFLASLGKIRRSRRDLHTHYARRMLKWAQNYYSKNACIFDVGKPPKHTLACVNIAAQAIRLTTWRKQIKLLPQLLLKRAVPLENRVSLAQQLVADLDDAQVVVALCS